MENFRKLISAKEAAEILGLKSSSGVLHHLQKGHIEGVLIQAKTRRRYRYYEDSVYRYKNIKDGKSSAFGSIDIAMDEDCRPLLSLKYQSPYAPFYFPQKQYLVTSYGKVWDLSNNRLLAELISGNGHIQVQILFRGKTEQVLLHRIVATMFCPNGKFKNVVHHIDCCKTNNKADNLIWVTSEEHGTLHSLWKECKTQDNLKQYEQAIEIIKKDNVIKVPYRFIEERIDDNGIVYLMVTEDAYKRISEGANTNTLTADDILAESYLNIPHALKQECPV